MRRLIRWMLGLALMVAVLAFAGFAWFVLWPMHTIPALEPVDEYVWLDQNWGEGQNSPEREIYYYTAQGTAMPQGASAGAVRYSWFVHLELPFSEQRFADPDHMRRYRFVVDPEPSPATRISCPSASPGTSTRPSARTCSISPAPPVTPARSISRRMAATTRCASTAARPCTPSPT